MEKLEILITMSLYMAAIIGIGFYYYKKANQSSENYFLGGRTLGPWVTAMSAEASDMSGWLLMGLPGVAYWLGISDALGTARGLFAGTALNWIIVSRRLRFYSEKTESITLPEFFSARFHEEKKVILTISSVFIFIFFSVYAASCFVTFGKLFSALFGQPYIQMMIAGAVFVVFYTFVGGFLAESVSDFMQAIVMIISLLFVLVGGIMVSGGLDNVINNLNKIPGFLDMFGIATPVMENGVQKIAEGSPVFGPAGNYSLLSVVSTMAWGVGYFGMPQVLLRFMAIRDADELGKSKVIAIIWCSISLFVAVFIGLLGRDLYPAELTTSAASETVFILLTTKLFPPLLAGIVMAGILAATISSADSYLLIAASAFAKNIYGLVKKDVEDKEVMKMSRIILLVLTVIGIIIALDEKSIIFQVVSFAWAGFGATFGPLMLFSLFWRKITRKGAIAGMLSGGITVFVWKLLIKPMGGVFGIYELLPAFLISCAFIIVVSLMDKDIDQKILNEFDEVKEASK